MYKRQEDYIGRKDAFPVKGGWSLKSQLYSIPDCQSIIKKAIVTRLQQAYGVSWFEESGSTCAVDFSIHHDQDVYKRQIKSPIQTENLFEWGKLRFSRMCPGNG